MGLHSSPSPYKLHICCVPNPRTLDGNIPIERGGNQDLDKLSVLFIL